MAYFGWELEEDEERAREMLDVALANGVGSIWLSLGNDLGPFVDYIRQSDLRRQREEKTNIFVLVNSVNEALIAGNEWNTDVLVAQGTCPP